MLPRPAKVQQGSRPQVPIHGEGLRWLDEGRIAWPSPSLPAMSLESPFSVNVTYQGFV